MKIIRPKNPDSRMPSWLQPNTKENLIWQAAMTVLFIGGMTAYDRYQERKFRKEYEASLLDYKLNGNKLTINE